MSESGYDLQSLAGKLCSIVGEENVLVDEPMSEHTTFKVGGPADLYVIPDDPDEVKEILLAVKDVEAPYFILGYGSDLLVSDAGYRGVIIAVADGLTGVSIDAPRCLPGRRWPQKRRPRWPVSWTFLDLSLRAASQGLWVAHAS